MLIADDEWAEVSVFITVKTYPTPSRKHRETVCTAGITDKGEWIRLYPVPYRYLKDSDQYPKYCWIKARVSKPRDDSRPDSFRLDVDSLRIDRKIRATPKEWSERNSVIFPTVSPSLDFLEQRYSETKQSLGIFRPKTIKSLEFEPNKKLNSSRITKNELLSQLGLFDEKPPKDLEPMPYNFYFNFDCEHASCKGHRKLIIDWEIFALFRRMRALHGEERALELVKNKYLSEVCSPNRDTHFIVGTDHRFGQFMIIGIYWPPKTDSVQTSLLI